MMDLTEYVILPGADYKAACDAVREKTGKTDGMRSGELAQEILAIAPRLQEKTVTPGLEPVSLEADTGFDGLSSVTVEAIKLQEKTAVASETAQTITPDAGFAGLSKVIVEAAEVGTAVQIAEGRASFGSRSTTVDVGFRPDLVVIHGFLYYDERKRKNYQTQLACLFESENEQRMVVANLNDYYNIESYITQTSTGFTADRIYAWTLEGNDTSLSSKTYNYTAVKYTE